MNGWGGYAAEPMNLDQVTFLRDLSPEQRAALLAQAQKQQVAPGSVLFYEGDPVQQVYLLVEGRCSLTQGGVERRDVLAPALLDPLAVLGGLPHGMKVTAAEDCSLLCWSVDQWWALEAIATAARRYLAAQLKQAQTRLAELTTPIHYRSHTAELLAGPFRFENVTMLFAFCETDHERLASLLPPDLNVFQRPARRTAPLLIALAKFPSAYFEDAPDARFAYTETTFFAPVRYKTAVGLYVPFIYPSTYEPILLGREIYGFPKQLGETTFEQMAVSLTVNGENVLRLAWEDAAASSETRLVRALSDWLGIEGHLTAAAFGAGEVLRKVTRLPATRRVDVYNHKRLPAAESTLEQPLYAVNQLTRATFGVLRWHQIAKLDHPTLTRGVSPLSDALSDITLREAYRTQLDMRLSVGRVIKNYLALHSENSVL